MKNKIVTMQNEYKLCWTSLNQPLDGKSYFWELGTIVDFHIEPLQERPEKLRRIFLSGLELKPETRLIVTSIKDTKTTDVEHPRFMITLYRFENGYACGEAIMLGFRTAVCNNACWLEKVDTYTVRIAENEKAVIVNEYGQVFQATES